MITQMKLKQFLNSKKSGDFGNILNSPLAEDYYYNSTYAFSENKVVAHVEIEGLEAENFMSKFKKPGQLSIKRPSANAQQQSFNVSVRNPTKSFSEIRDNFLSSPQNLLSNSKADFNAPVNGEGKPPLARGCVSCHFV